jgi:DNA-binding GntR family transcriptional regulator
MGSADDAEQRVMDAIREYLVAHPRATDSADGIAQWWLGDEAAASVQLVRRALERLVADGTVRVIASASGEHLYSSGRRRIESAAETSASNGKGHSRDD